MSKFKQPTTFSLFMLAYAFGSLPLAIIHDVANGREAWAMFDLAALIFIAFFFRLEIDRVWRDGIVQGTASIIDGVKKDSKE